MKGRGEGERGRGGGAENRRVGKRREEIKRLFIKYNIYVYTRAAEVECIERIFYILLSSIKTLQTTRMNAV